MSKLRRHVGNALGDVRAESDHKMLDAAFYNTPDYLSLIESADKTVVVGRRGAGKSALAYQLSKYWYGVPKTKVVRISLDPDQVIGLTPVFELLGGTYRLICAGCRIAWRYSLEMELCLELSKTFKFKKADESGILSRHLQEWRKAGDTITGRIRRLLQDRLVPNARPETQIADIASKFELVHVENAVGKALRALGFRCVILIDRLDEGYTPSDVGVGFIDGIVEGTIDLKGKFEQAQPVLFLRDNMFRTVALKNPDYSRNIEGQVIRLHWSERHLMNMVCERLRVVFGIKAEKSAVVWNRCTARELQGLEGFRKCLRLTLYRPRDILLLLNDAFRAAAAEEREQIILADVESTAKSISMSRLVDLHKEYAAIFPGLQQLTSAFSYGKAEVTLEQAEELLQGVLESPTHPLRIEQEFAIIGTAHEAVRALYGIGFLGIRDVPSGTYIFSHDGHSQEREIRRDDSLLVHPCYSMALNLTSDMLDLANAEGIHDEYDIAVTEYNVELRSAKLGQLVSALPAIPEGDEGQSQFEEWCHSALSTAFAGALRNIELCERKAPSKHRDIITLNLSRTEAWTRVFEDWQARQVLFHVENAKGVTADVYWKAASELSDANGHLVFLITRDNAVEVQKGGELDWIRAIYEKRSILVVKLTGDFLSRMLGKLRNPQKHDVVEKAMNILLNTYGRYHLRNAKRRGKLANTAPESTSASADEIVAVDLPTTECYGELHIDNSGHPLLRIFHKQRGPGRPSEIRSCQLQHQAYTILETGLKNAQHLYTVQCLENAKQSGQHRSRSECEPSEETTLIVQWSQDDLAKILHDKERFSDLNKPKKEAIKTAMSRVRWLVAFPNDTGLVTEPDSQPYIRESTIQLRFSRSGSR